MNYQYKKKIPKILNYTNLYYKFKLTKNIQPHI